jgi:hypothetical protein
MRLSYTFGRNHAAKCVLVSVVRELMARMRSVMRDLYGYLEGEY